MNLHLTLLLVYMVFAHTVADFMFQTDDMAVNKSSSNRWLLKHTLTYALVFGTLIGYAVFFFVPTVGVGSLLTYVAVNFVAHTATDYVTSRITSYYWKQEKRHEFFVTIGFDQFAHIAVLMLTWSWLFGA